LREVFAQINPLLFTRRLSIWRRRLIDDCRLLICEGERQMDTPGELEDRFEECDELIAIFVWSVRTAEANQ
jgi:hypothetical protein